MITSLSWVTAKIHFWSALEEHTDCGLPMHTKFCVQNVRSDNKHILHKWLDYMLLLYKQLLLVKHRTPKSYAIYTKPTTSYYNTGYSQRYNMSQPHFGQVWGWSPTLGKVGGLESSGTPECSELDSKVQNTLHWGVLSVIGKVLKRRYRKWPRIGHSDIFSPSYGQKKGRESNWQFDSRPLKVGNRPVLDVALKSATHHWKALDESYNFD
jgi:hypothetical protein